MYGTGEMGDFYICCVELYRLRGAYVEKQKGKGNRGGIRLDLGHRVVFCAGVWSVLEVFIKLGNTAKRMWTDG